MQWSKKHIISIKDFSRAEIDFVLEKSARMEGLLASGKSTKLMSDKILATLFFEPSTRTKMSFEAAMLRLGGRVIGFSGVSDTSIEKGETMLDTVRMAAGYADMIVMRHPVEGSSRLASENVDVPVINGGDGANQHPTQTLLDLYTIKKQFGKIDGMNICMVGDLKYGRTIHSLVDALKMYDVELRFISPQNLKIPAYMTKELKKSKIKFEEREDLNVQGCDIVYVQRIQRERFPDPQEYEKVKDCYVVDLGVADMMKENAIIMHALPRVTEIKHEVDETKNAKYFQQARNGVPVRMAVLCLVSGVDF
ncbi:MAG: aspartate carbamoyltransferase [Candidatus Altiarchaeales archaeon IMC4]|nr:MAG: aspartate carbamoyltransferase [Candidatus Altiarchaeales archaeon IMC4]